MTIKITMGTEPLTADQLSEWAERAAAESHANTINTIRWRAAELRAEGITALAEAVTLAAEGDGVGALERAMRADECMYLSNFLNLVAWMEEP